QSQDLLLRSGGPGIPPRHLPPARRFQHPTRRGTQLEPGSGIGVLLASALLHRRVDPRVLAQTQAGHGGRGRGVPRDPLLSDALTQDCDVAAAPVAHAGTRDPMRDASTGKARWLSLTNDLKSGAKSSTRTTARAWW